MTVVELLIACVINHLRSLMKEEEDEEDYITTIKKYTDLN
jgi:hypothetical protein